MEVSPFLEFKGECEAAFEYYALCLGATLGGVFRYTGTPLADQVPADWQDKVMHSSLTIGLSSSTASRTNQSGRD